MGKFRLGISPVVTTAILLTIATLLAVAVAFWATSIVKMSTDERLEVRSAYVDGENGQVVLTVENVGSSTTVIYAVSVDNRFTERTYIPITAKSITQVTIPLKYFIVGGIANEVVIRTTSGRTYSTVIIILD
jgi:hypothetical protein